ncbi:two-component regulator propeller domain-containing protein [uncultured Polaribacter sp.]|uniref:hybrid sensor histidine kinase/response regulator transcription factor n=1 Tax=uncultured Polaribacter sp. TaxID=174711 RepID=UPI002609D24B|nr:two-component regulator propeller domain-containing protein [uncultured Polaribacter sp.]
MESVRIGNKVIFFLLLIAVCLHKSFGAPNTILKRQKLSNELSERRIDILADSLKTNKANYYNEQLDNTNGLSNSSVNTIFQDSEHLLWIGTWDGLNRFNGKDFKIFRPELNNENSLSNQVILKIDEDDMGYIWVLTMHGLNRYDKKSNTFKRYYFSRKDKPLFSESEFNMTLDASKKVYCAVKDWGIGYFDGNDFQLLNTKNLPTNAIKKMTFAPTGALLLLLDNNELYSLKIKTTKIGAKIVSQNEKILNDVKDFEVLSSDKICFISTSGSTVLYSFKDQTKLQINKGTFLNIISSTKEGLLLHDNSGYFIMDSLGTTTNNSWVKNLKNKNITTLIQGTENIIWTGTDGDGLFKMNPLKKVFHLVSKAQVPEMDGGIVRVFLEVEGHSFWVGTKGKGLFRFPSKFYLNPNEPLSYQHFNESNSLINNAVFSLCKGRNDLVFIGTDGEGMDVFDLKNSKLISWQDIVGNEACAYFKSTYAIYQDEKGFIWLGTNGYGMIRFKISRLGGTLKVTDFKQYLAANDTDGYLSSNIIFSIVPKSNNELWLGTRLGGLNLFNKETGSFKTFKNSKSDSQSLSNNDILCLHTDANKKLWIGTSLGLNLLEEFKDEETPRFKNFTVNEGLPNNTIHGIVSDEESNLWISTNFGVSNFIFKDSKFINYTKNEGLQNNEFADGAFYQNNSTDFVFMGGIKGFNYFLPSKIEESQVIPDLLIDKISGQNQDAPYYQSLVISTKSKTYPSIVLEHDQNFFDIELAALTYINSEKCQYAYKLDNFDQDWNTINNRRIISFTNVPKGSYALWLKWSNSDGVWSDAVHAVDIKIKPVYWQSNVALFIYLILLGLFLLFVWSYFRKQYKLRQNIIFQKREEEIHQNRLTFFTNIAHEFQTPLTLIVGPVQKLAESENLGERSKKFINMIQRNASRLLFLTQQLLEFRKAEYDYLEVTVKQFDLVNLIEQIAELFDEWALDKNIKYDLELPLELIGWYDKDKIEKIIFNLLSNAFKYTPKDGSIKLEFNVKGDAIKTLCIIVSNTGKGISKEKLDSLFDRFFLSDVEDKSDTGLFRTGIGLAYIKKLITVLRGEIEVSSRPNKITMFTITIPCSKESFKDNEIDTEGSQILISDYLKNILEETPNETEDTFNKMSSLEAFLEQRKVILIVEDEKEIQLFLNELLKEKYKIIIVNNGFEAIERMKKELPDIIITDVMMPIMDGISFCKKVKNDDRTCHIPLIMLTAKSSIQHRIEGLESGANSYIPKPFHPDHILVRVQKLIEERELILKQLSQDTFIENIKDLPVHNDDKELLRNVIKLIRNNIDNENLQSLFIEEKLGISNSQLYRKIKQSFGFSPADLIRTIRLKYAAELLRKSNCTVSEVCYRSGFNNRSYFYREFKKMYNSTPKNYQMNNNSGII